MATRRAHNKSRLGCHQCKKRRIKCDGKQPTCANCDKRRDTCSFLMLAPSSSLLVTPTTRSASPTSSRLSTSSNSSTPEKSRTQSPETLSPSSCPTPSNELALTPTTPYNFQVLNEELPFSFLPTASPSLHTPPYYLDLSIPPSLRPNDAWKDIRAQLAPSLQEVLQHYEYTTSLTLANDDPAKAAWQTHIPELAHDHNYLMNCVLSIAALHLARLHDTPASKARMNALAAARMNKALVEYRPQLGSITQHNAAALFASSTLLAVYLFRTSALDIEALRSSIPPTVSVPPPATADKMLACVLRTVWGLRGPLAVLLGGWKWVFGGKMQPVAARKWWPKDPVPATPRAVLEDEQLSQLESLWMQSDRCLEPESAHLSEALGLLRETFALVSQLTLPEGFRPMTAVPYSVDDTTVGVLTDRGAVFVWATRISREFMALVEEKDRDALVILAHYAVLPGRVRNVWWLEGLGADFVTAIAMTLGRENWDLIAWPASVVGVDLENAFSIRKDNLEGRPDELHMAVI